jgi:hypothetical protein
MEEPVKLKNLGLVAITLVSTVSHAESWHKIMSCENGAVVIDVNQDERRALQIVFRGERMLRRMRDTGMIWPNFGDNESILRGVHADLRQVSPTETRPESLGGVFYTHDLKKIHISHGYTGYEAEVRGSEVLFKKFGVNSGSSCPDWNDMECRGGVYHQTYVFAGEVALRGCETEN